MTNSSHTSGPLNVGPTSPAGNPSAQGTVVLAQTYDMDITETTDVEAFRLAANSGLVGMDVAVTTASDAGDSATLKLTNADGDVVTDFDVTATGLLSVRGGDATIADLGRYLDPVSNAPGNLSLVYEEAGTESTEGEFEVRLYYMQGQ